jgi:hypothetical protein
MHTNTSVLMQDKPFLMPKLENKLAQVDILAKIDGDS